MRTVDNSTTAAIPGGLSLSRRRYVEYFGTNAIDRLFYRFCSRLPWVARHLPIIGARVHHWTCTREHLQYGCLNPAVVIDSAKGLIAVFTSLTAIGYTPTPVLKILHERLDMISRSRTTNGSRFAAASLYSRTQESLAQGQWNDFFPIVVDCLVDDDADCEDAIVRIKPPAWKALEIALQQHGAGKQKGLYSVDVPHDIVRDAY